MDEPTTHSSMRDSLSKAAIDHLVLPAVLLVQVIAQESGDLYMRGLDVYDGLRDNLLRGPARDRSPNL